MQLVTFSQLSSKKTFSLYQVLEANNKRNHFYLQENIEQCLIQKIQMSILC